MKTHEICRLGIARTFQEIRTFQEMSALENVLAGVYFRHRGLAVGKAHEIKEAEELLDAVGLSAKKQVVAKHYRWWSRESLRSRGRFLIRPVLLLLDEVLAGLIPGEIDAGLGNDSQDQGIIWPDNILYRTQYQGTN